MNAEALLKAYGWSGSGSLDSHNGSDSRGLSKPLLISKKVDVLGVGLNKHAAVSDQWWMRAYDSGLKDLGTGKKSTLAEVREKGMFAGGLYGRFVKGESEGGTLQLEAKNKKNKRKRSEEESDSGYESKNGKRRKTEGERRVKKSVLRTVDRFVVEAKRRNLLEGAVSKFANSKSVVDLYGEETVAAVFKDAGLSHGGELSTSSAKQRRYSNEKQLRQLKKVAKEFVISQLSPGEQAELQNGGTSSDNACVEKQLVEDQAEAARVAAKAAKKEAKLAQKQKDREMKAWEKGITIEEYLRQREEKKASKSKLRTENAESLAIPAFVVDSVGDDTLTAQANQVVDATGNVRNTTMKEVPISSDTAIGNGIEAKKLPKPVRKPRAQSMHKEREAKNSSKARVKIAKQESLTLRILTESRKAEKGTKRATIGGLEDVPLIAVTSKKGEAWTKAEMKQARTAARRTIKNEKKKTKKTKMGRGAKKYKIVSRK